MLRLKDVHFDAALNLVWLALGLGVLAFVAHVSPPFRQGRIQWRGSRLAGVAVFAITLFPYVSATDDLVWVEAATSVVEHTQDCADDGSQKASARSISLLQSCVQDWCSAPDILDLSPSYAFFILTAAPACHGYDWNQTHSAGRSPPASSKA